jgi:hypothetical protein
LYIHVTFEPDPPKKRVSAALLKHRLRLPARVGVSEVLAGAAVVEVEVEVANFDVTNGEVVEVETIAVVTEIDTDDALLLVL